VVSALLIYFVATKQTFQSMGKSSNFIGQPLFNQLIKLISRQKIQEIAQKGGYNRYVTLVNVLSVEKANHHLTLRCNFV